MSRSRANPLTMVCCTLLAGAIGSSGCSAPSEQTSGTPIASPPSARDIESNPFYGASGLPFEAPPFDRIEDADYQPALEDGMRRQIAEIEAIAANAAPPTFDNTVVAMERSGQMLARAEAAFEAVTGANTNDTLQKVQEEEAPKLAAHHDAIVLNTKLFARLAAVYEARHTLSDPEARRLVEYLYDDFVRAGARLSDADKARLKEMNEELSTLEAQFESRLLAAARAAALVVDDRTRLAGMSDAAIAAAAQAAASRNLDGRWVVPLQNTTQQPALSSIESRDVRQALFDASWTRAEKGDSNDTRGTIARLAQLRAERAKLLGFENEAAWKLQDQMAKTPATVMTFLDRLVPAATSRVAAEARDRQAAIDAERTAAKQGTFELQPWDWTYYGEQVRRARYALDEAQIKPYFELDRVLQDGVFYAANQLYGLTFKERHDIPVWQPDVRVFEVVDTDGTALGLFYADYFARDNKSGGAWMNNLVTQSTLLGTRPVIYNVANFTKPAPGEPALLSFDDVTTMFHEFGHALHGFFADQRYPSISGTNVARDFVEFPSQFNEHWALTPGIFSHYARHYQTGEPMPTALVEKLKSAHLFDKGYEMTELLSAALLDMSWHTLSPGEPLQDVDAFESASLLKNHVNLSYVPPRYRSSYFLHIWANGYDAGYYAYLWTQMLADDAFAGFEERGGLTRANGDRFREMILSRGNTEDLARMYRDWRGHDPEIGPMLVERGLQPD